MKPIIFNAEMVRAILAGRKTQTQRVIKQVDDLDEFTQLQSDVDRTDAVFQDKLLEIAGVDASFRIKFPYDTVGKQLWIRETWATDKQFDSVKPSEIPKHLADIWYAARGAKPEWAGRTRPSIFMPWVFSRITLKITDVRVQRVQDVSGEDCIAEGATSLAELNLGLQRSNPTSFHEQNRLVARRKFARLWDAINAKRGYGWEANPWVWVIEFKRV